MRPFLIAVAVLALGACSKQTPAPASHAGAARATAPIAGAIRVTPAQRSGGNVATLPDRGTLAAYVPGAAVKRDAYTWHPVEISEAHALASIVTGELTLTDPEGRQIHLRADRHIEHADGNWTWIGHRAGDTPGNEAILTFGPTAVFGVIPTVGGDTLRLTTLQGRTWMIETDPAREAAMNKGKWSDDALRVNVDAKGPRMASAGAEPVTASAGPVTANASASNTVDMVVGYTPSFAARFGGATGANTRLTFMVDVANQAYAASQVDGALRMVGSVQVNYTVNNSNTDALYAVSGKNCVDTTNGGLSCTDKTVPAELQPLHAAREQFGADVVALVRNFDQATQGGCGIAWLIGSEQTPIVAADQEWAFAVVSDSNGDNAPSNGYICRDETLVHEVGHLMGLQHDRESASGTNGTLEPEEYGRYPYSFGYRGGSAGVYTVMAYFSSGNAKVRVFSNPNVLCAPPTRSPAPCGIADQADNARAMRQTMPVVSQFRAMVVPLAGVRRPLDFNLDGKDDLLWSNRTIGQADLWFMNGPAWQHGGSQLVPSQYFVAGRGDFDGDGRGDILWEDGNTIWIWRKEPTGGFSVQFVANHPHNNWQIVGVGDFNGDGRSDIFWSNRVIGQADWWLMNGAGWQHGGSQSVPGQYRVAGIGDLNGDGRSDVIWEDGATLWDWQAAGTGFSVNFIDNYPPATWSIAGVGDLNGDGFDDLVWSNRTIGQADWWLMGGATRLGIGSKSVPGQYRIAMLGDFDGDGRRDIYWEDGSTMWIWDAETWGFNTLFVGNYPPQPWTIKR